MRRKLFEVRTAVAIFLIAIGSALVPAYSQDGTPMSADEINSFLKGKSLSANRLAGGTPTLQFRNDGALYGRNGNATDIGKWWVDGGKLCMKWSRWDYDGCGTMLRVGNEVHHFYPGTDARTHLVFN